MVVNTIVEAVEALNIPKQWNRKNRRHPEYYYESKYKRSRKGEKLFK